MNTVRRPRRLAMAVASLGLALAASGCTYLNPVQTHDFYEAADGTNATLYRDGMQFAGVRNAILVVDEPGDTVLYASVVNYTTEPVTVDLKGTDDSGAVLFTMSIDVPADGSVQISPSATQNVTVSKDVETGVILGLEVTAEGESETISLPTTGTSLEWFVGDEGSSQS